MTGTRAALRPRLWEIAVVLLTLFAPDRGSGQSQGTVVVIDVADAITGAPLQNARVRISDLHRLARTDWLGEARLPHVPAGEHRIEARQLGYGPVETHLLVRGDSIGVVFRLLRSAETLDTIRINGSVIPRYLREFELRRRMGSDATSRVGSSIASHPRRSPTW